ncbi:hypothetical protein SAMN02745217_02608 [Anaerocolumna xylanovorans DSM 12503]|uniref:Uncharacterized protein n=1 Tax=Anaerocolumna xylanovorans DSM 12503 TaxID=1121345 RepID=A0A1M7YBZ3_9FIRM|nr:hypothetical protein SAMN02745217_02608 [Anaerocolumna xylanovorans DSM 12503]
MSMNNRNSSKYYADSITRVTDPFWKVTCGGCGHTYLSCIAISNCPTCGCPDGERFLGETPYDEVIAERVEPKMNFASEEARKIYYEKSE